MSNALNMPIASVVAKKGRILSREERIDPATTALVLIDLQNEFCHAEGAFARLGHDVSAMPAVAENTHRLVNAARERNMMLLFVRAAYDGEVLSGPLAETYNRRQFTNSQCLEGTWDADWYAGLSPREGDANEITVVKHRFSAFWGTDIDLMLRSNGICSLVFTGVVTSGCVESTLRDAFFRDYYVVCAEDCVAEASPERHDASLTKMRQAFGEVLKSERSPRSGRRPSPRPASRCRQRNSASWGYREAHRPRTYSRLPDIDLQNDFCHSDGVMGRAGEDLTSMREAINGSVRLLKWARDAGMRVIHVRAEYSEQDASDVSLFASRERFRHCLLPPRNLGRRDG